MLEALTETRSAFQNSERNVCAQSMPQSIQVEECPDVNAMMNKQEHDEPLANTRVSRRPCQRVLTVLIHIGKHGPASMEQISEGLGLHKSTVWRSIEALKGLDLVRVQRGTGLIELRNVLQTALSDFHFADRRVEAADAIVMQLQGLRYTFVDVGVFKEPGVFRVQESTRRGRMLDTKRSLVFDHLAIAAQLSLPRRLVDLHLREYSTTDPQEAFEIRSGSHVKMLEKLRDERVIWADDSTACAIVLPFARGMSIGAEIYRPTKLRIERLRQVVDEIVSEFSRSA